MAWVLLIIAAVLEPIWAGLLKHSNGFTRGDGSGVLAVLTSIASFALLSRALRSLPLGTCYAVWAGLGAAGTTLLGIWWFRESYQPLRLVWIFLIVLGVIGLHWDSTRGGSSTDDEPTDRARTSDVEPVDVAAGQSPGQAPRVDASPLDRSRLPDAASGAGRDTERWKE